MPLYEYDTPNGVVTAVRSVERRDCVPPSWKRRIASRFGLCFGRGPVTAEADAIRGLHKLENRHGSGVFEREMGYTGKQLKKIWQEDN
jgi:hypothetical protein